MIIWVIRYYDVDSDDKPPMRTEFYRSLQEVQARRQEVEDAARKYPDSFYFKPYDDIAMIEYSNTDELVAELNKLNVNEFNKS